MARVIVGVDPREKSVTIEANDQQGKNLGMGRPLAQRLLADGETVVDVPAKLAARVRVFDISGRFG